ncbi:MAG: tryptophan--tRNA ligase [Candidatus Ratteibacteria bacterium]|nr:tryptophan--tRNA ligase [Candidatus Ratteibacteria bacterium]
MSKKRILSGMRPTGRLHLGHWLGALKKWVELQDNYQCFYMIADWHALMSEYANPKDIKANIRECLLDWLSVGIESEKATFFIQSEVKEHAELHLLLSMISPLSWLERCPTYKEQLRELKTRDISTYAYLGYPILQAADIIIYKADAVPVGNDQLPHLELTREIVRRFHHFYGKSFPEPEPILTETPKLLGLDNRKMSKSYNNFIALADSPETISKKVTSMITDPKRIRKTDKGHPGICNVFSYQEIFNRAASEEIENACKKGLRGCTECKKMLAETLIVFLADFRARRKTWEERPEELSQILEKGKCLARKVAGDTLQEVRKKMGLV